MSWLKFLNPFRRKNKKLIKPVANYLPFIEFYKKYPKICSTKTFYRMAKNDDLFKSLCVSKFGKKLFLHEAFTLIYLAHQIEHLKSHVNLRLNYPLALNKFEKMHSEWTERLKVFLGDDNESRKAA